MDPLTQGVLGAAAAQAVFGEKLGRKTAWIGALAGMAPDLDVLISSASDPLLAVEFHRQFTHSLAFIPVGGVVCALPWLAARANRTKWKEIVAASVIGYATHGLLDACTTYGTQLLWPFSNARIAWDNVAIVDPVFTIALLIGVVIAARRVTRTPAIAALGIALAYLGLGVVQRERALGAQARLASSRGHPVGRVEVFPTIGNQLVWRSLYESGPSLYVDRIRVPWIGAPSFARGTFVTAVSPGDLPAELLAHPRFIDDFARFHWFSGGYVARDPADPTVFGDVRYSQRNEVFEPIWGVRFHPGRAVPTEWVNKSRDRKVSVRELFGEIAGTDSRYHPIP